ncbi:MAG: outer membrane protein transport protein [Sulfurimonas sp.]|uniref:OmpP1/FadL family transporter n=1 Tax=Sulfurimonas sp. TaxID=2022749 RepID=UPI00262D0933|nr:outer membrane protein transport protein [Sulfurimonas sp.]MDD2651489.1 outer membrane protein transport protein [Sulfurimonas sp.]MDD3451030.1 outer membrane protein transport protein [Sulfurimonas sp.]
MKSLVLLSLAACALFAGGYKIPESSLNSVALSAAGVAHSEGADAAYYNPANMVFMKNEHTLEANLFYIGLSDVEYKSASTTINAKREDFIVPSLHYVSQDIKGMRFGLSVVSPAGLSKRWSDAPAVYSAEEFTLKTVELNPSVAFKINEKTGVALGVRAIYSEGVVKSTSPIASRDMDGDSLDFGYNLALSYKPVSELELALTYRSNVDLSVKGDALLSYTGTLGGSVPLGTYTSSSSASVSVLVPALFNAAIAYTFATKTTLEFVYERNFWSEYKELDFNYGSSVSPVTNVVFGTPIAKNWKDTDVFRFGVTQRLDALTLMGGVVIDESPVPEKTLGFELPDSDSVSVSLGARYRIDEKLSVGLAALYSIRDERKVTNSSINGEFSNANVLIVASALEYRF